MTDSAGITNDSARSVKSNALTTAALAVIQTLTISILAILLDPNDFGLFAIVLVFVNFGRFLTDFGINNAIIHFQDMDDNSRSSLYWITVVFGLVLFVCFSLLAPVVALIFGIPDLFTLLLISNIVFLLLPFGDQFAMLLQKGFMFPQLNRIKLLSSIGGSAITIYLAAVGAGAFALVIGNLFNVLIWTALLLFVGLRRWGVHFRCQLADIRRYLRFIAFQFADKSMSFIFKNIDKPLIGFFFGTHLLGLYSFAWNLAHIPLGKLAPVITQVGFPALARVQKSIDKVRRGYEIILDLLSFILIPVYFGLFITTPLIFELLFGHRWDGAIFFMQVFCIMGAMRAVIYPSNSLSLALGRPDLNFSWSFFYLALFLCALTIAIGTHDIYLFTLGMLSIDVILLLRLHHHFHAPLLRQHSKGLYSPIYTNALFSAVMLATVHCVNILGFFSGFTKIGIMVFLGMALYAGLHLLFNLKKVLFLCKHAFGRVNADNVN